MAFVMETQELKRWCWAAVAVSVKHFFSAGSALTQCQVATPVLIQEGKIPVARICCLTKNLCNFTANLQDALNLPSTNNLRQIVTAPLPFDGAQSVKSEIGRPSNTPIAARIGWSNGGGHFIALIGYKEYGSGAQTVHVADPYYGPSWQYYDDLLDFYLEDGAWSDSFLLKA
jgi:Papain-like cysteine protease AvrRpt2